MKRKKRIGVVADDVTGANDIGIMFQKGGYRAAVFPLGLLRACDCDLREEAEGLEVIIIDTDSRLDRPEDARKKVRKATELLMTLPCDMYHNKTCSVFRGNIGAEFDEMQDVLGVSCSMVILGFPENGRTTVDGIHYVYGRKLEESQFRNDPIHKMTTSSLEEILHRQSARPAGHITWRDLDQGLVHVMEKKERLKKQCSYVIFDIRDQADLRLSALAVAFLQFRHRRRTAMGNRTPAERQERADAASGGFSDKAEYRPDPVHEGEGLSGAGISYAGDLCGRRTRENDTGMDKGGAAEDAGKGDLSSAYCQCTGSRGGDQKAGRRTRTFR